MKRRVVGVRSHLAKAIYPSERRIMAVNAESNTLEILLAVADVVGPQAAANPASSEVSMESGRATQDPREPAHRAYLTPSSMAEAINKLTANLTMQFSAIHSKMDGLAQRVNAIEATERSSETSTLEEVTGITSTPWADRDPLERNVYNASVVFGEDDHEPADDTVDGCEIHQVSQRNGTFLTDAFSKSVPNATRRK